MLMNCLITPQYQEYFFEPYLYSFYEKLKPVMSDTATMYCLPDMVIKKNSFPNGLAITDRADHAVLLPRLLRDPGCGFLLFRIKAQSSQFNQAKQQQLFTGLCQATLGKRASVQMPAAKKMKQILEQGAEAVTDDAHILQKVIFAKYVVDLNQLALSQDVLNILASDFGFMTNSVEIRHTQDGELYGFIHSGCNQFPDLLFDLIVKRIIEEAVYAQRYPLENYAKGLHGVALESATGQIYSHWLKAAMNYAVASRLYIFEQVKRVLEQQADVAVELINDHTHAGLFVEADQVVMSRGAQCLTVNPAESDTAFRVIAGECASIASLVHINPTATVPYLPHGTGYALLPEQLAAERCQIEELNYQHYADVGLYNADVSDHNILNFTAQHLLAKDYFKTQQVITSDQTLFPWITVQGSGVQTDFVNG